MSENAAPSSKSPAPCLPDSGRRRGLLQMGSLVLLLGTQHIAWGATILAVRVWPAPDYSRVTLESDTPLVVKQFFVPSPPRLAVDIEGLQLNPALRELVAKVRPDDPNIAAIRVGQNTPTVVRLVIDLKQEAVPQVFTLQPVGPYKHRLVFDLYPAKAIDPLQALIEDRLREAPSPGTVAEAATDADHESLEALIAKHSGGDAALPPAATVAPAPKPAPAPEPASSSRATAHSTGRIIVVALDPGHGGEDPGAIGPRGTREKDVVLRIANLLRNRINATRINGVPMRAFMTRDADFFVPLGTRVAKARRVQADLFISIHADAFTRPAASGASVYVLSQKGATSTAARWLANKENQADLIGGLNVGSQDAGVQRLLLEMSTSAQVSASMRLGTAVLREIGRFAKLHKPHVEQAGFAVLKAPDIPSILVETAFISNPGEEQKLRTPAYQAKLADAMIQGIRQYFAQNPPMARSRTM